jgi:transposase-like protein
MQEEDQSDYVRRSQRDYSLSFKLQVVKEVEGGVFTVRSASRHYGIQSHSTITNWLRKYGTFDRELYVERLMEKTPQQRIFELEHEVRMLKRKNAVLERQAQQQDQKAIMFDAIVEIVQEDYNIDLLKKVYPERSVATSPKADKE